MALNSLSDFAGIDACPECGSAQREYIPEVKGSRHEPPSSGGENCFDCGHQFEEEDEATRLGI